MAGERLENRAFLETHRTVAPLSLRLDKRVVHLLNVYAEEVGRREVLPTLGAAVGVLVSMMGFVCAVGREHQRGFVGGQRAVDCNLAAVVIVGQIKLGDFGSRRRSITFAAAGFLRHTIPFDAQILSGWRGFCWRGLFGFAWALHPLESLKVKM